MEPTTNNENNNTHTDNVVSLATARENKTTKQQKSKDVNQPLTDQQKESIDVILNLLGHTVERLERHQKQYKETDNEMTNEFAQTLHANLKSEFIALMLYRIKEELGSTKH